MNEGGERVLELKRWEKRKRYEKRAVVGKKREWRIKASFQKRE